MTVDIRQIDYFSMTYIFIEDEQDKEEEALDVICEYEQIGIPKFSADEQSITFVLKNIDPEEDEEEYVATLIKKGSDEFYFKSNYFENASELYPLNAEIFDEEIKFTSASDGEVMYLYGFFG